MNFIKLLRSKKTVFRIDDIKKIFDNNNEQVIRNYLSKAKKQWLIDIIYPWIWYLKDKDINFFELSCKIRNRSYISFETILQKEWVIFQDYSNTITMASDNTITKEFSWKQVIYYKIKDSILFNPIGIIHQWTYIIASKERAICDRIYLTPGYYFDNLSNLNFEKLKEISQIYNKRVVLEVDKLIKNAKSN